jgi:hypothetical protein
MHDRGHWLVPLAYGKATVRVIGGDARMMAIEGMGAHDDKQLLWAGHQHDIVKYQKDNEAQ